MCFDVSSCYSEPSYTEQHQGEVENKCRDELKIEVERWEKKQTENYCPFLGNSDIKSKLV